MYQYPPIPNVDVRQTLPLLGSFWSEFYADNGQLQNLLGALGSLQWQQWRNVNENVDCVARRTIPVTHREAWYRLALFDSQVVSRGEPYRFGDELTFGSTAGNVHYFGEYRLGYTAYPCPVELLTAAAATNRLQDASVWLTGGTDFKIDLERGLILFRQDPFENPLCMKEDITVDGVVVRQTVLWLFQAELDHEYVQRQLGYVFKIWQKSSSRYRDLLNAVADAAVSGATRKHLEALLTAATEVTYGEAGEQVIDLYQDETRLLCVTDLRIHTFPPDAELLVAIGDTLTAGQPLIAGAELLDFRHGQVPDWLPGLYVGRHFLSPAIPGDLFFQNAALPLTLEDVDGIPQARFPVGGSTAAVAAFWAAVDAFGVSSGQTLAQRLDRRTAAATPPSMEFLPATINPLEFLVSNVWRENVGLLHLQQTAQSSWLQLPWSRLLRQLLPPHMTLILYVELTVLGDFGLLGEDAILDPELLADQILEDVAAGGVIELLRPIPILAPCN